MKFLRVHEGEEAVNRDRACEVVFSQEAVCMICCGQSGMMQCAGTRRDADERD
jgi:hypothetical protein